MTSVLEPTWYNVLLCSILFVVSGVIILFTLRKFEMKVATTVFSYFFFIIGAYIPFYFLGTMAMKTLVTGLNPSFTYFFLKNQIELLNAPFIFFESLSFIGGIISVVLIVAIIISIVFVVKFVIRAISEADSPEFHYLHDVVIRIVSILYIPDYHYTYLVTRRLRN